MKKLAALLGVLVVFGIVGVAWALTYRSVQTYVAASPVTGSAPSANCLNNTSPASSACGVSLSGITGVRVCVTSKNLTTGAVSGTLSGGGTLVGYLYDYEKDNSNQTPGNGATGTSGNARWKYSGGSLTLTIPASCSGQTDCCFADVTTQVKDGRAMWVPSGVTYAGGSATGVQVDETAFYSGTPGR